MTIELNPQQQQAVETKSKKALVLAGAGSGKTRVLTERIAHLIENEKVSPYEVLAITFTRKAAGEMRQRLEERLERASWGIEVGTMHAFALKLLHRFGDQLGLKPNTTVYSEWEEQFIIRDVAAAMGILKGKTWKVPKRDINDMFQGYYMTGAEPDSDLPGYRVFKGVVARFRENNALSYGSLLIGMRELLPMIGQFLNLRYVFVDEVQDLDPLQWWIINELCRLFDASLFLVGDVDQSIFEWRGACPGYLVEYQDTFDIYHLQHNYRSGRQIVEAANQLIKNNVDRIDKTMEPVKEGKEIFVWLDRDSMAIRDTMVTKDVWNRSSGGRVPLPNAILARNHVLLQKLSGLLDDSGIAHHYVGQQSKLTNTEPFRRFHAFLKLIVNPMDNFSFLLIKDLIGLSEKEYRSVRLEAATCMQSHWHAWYKKAPLTENEYAVFFNDGINHESLASAAIKIQYMATGALPFKDEDEWGMDTEPTFRFVMTYLSENSTATIQDYLDWLATYDIQDDMKEKDDRLQLMTIHAAKGLEWPCVMISGCNEGLLPSKQALKNGELEAERRLMYVAMTRAEDNLILAVRPESKEYRGKTYKNPISRFIAEFNL